MGKRLTLISIKKAVNGVLKRNFTDINLYDKGTVEGFKRPAFFTSLVPLISDHETINFNTNRVMVVINYFSEDKKGRELDNLKMHDKLIEAFGLNIKVDKRTILLSNIRSEQVDEVLQFRFDLNYKDHLERQKEERDIIEEIELEVNKKE